MILQSFVGQINAGPLSNNNHESRLVAVDQSSNGMTTMSTTGFLSRERRFGETGISGVLLEGLSRAYELAMVPVRFYRARSELAALGALSDHELSDVGLTRSDLASVSALPAGSDPTSALAAIVNDRRRWRRAG
jgi:uncharacterized protein YjiS (DUF1127 family)